MKWKIFERKNSENSRRQNLDEYEKEYISRMKDDQNDIYYISGESIEQVIKSPQIEGFNSRGLEVLFMVDPVDEFWLPSFNEYEGKGFKSITKGNADLSKFNLKEDKESKKKILTMQ